MEIENVRIPAFKVGNKTFNSEEEAKYYIAQIEGLLSYRWYTVHVNPDLTEGKRYDNKITVAVPKSSKQGLLQYLFVTYKDPIKLVMGYSPIEAWLYQDPDVFNTPEELIIFLQKPIKTLHKEEKRVPIILNDCGVVTDYNLDFL
jgi:hypothetical protein